MRTAKLGYLIRWTSTINTFKRNLNWLYIDNEPRLHRDNKWRINSLTCVCNLSNISKKQLRVTSQSWACVTSYKRLLSGVTFSPNLMKRVIDGKKLNSTVLFPTLIKVFWTERWKEIHLSLAKTAASLKWRFLFVHYRKTNY